MLLTDGSYLMLAAKDPEMMSKYTAPGIASTMLSNRISWFFDLKGASVTLDTACSSSMVALDMACQGLWNHTANTVRIYSRLEDGKIIITPSTF